MVEIFDKLKKVFNENGFRLFMIGSTSRDYILGREILDFDFVSDAKPFEIERFLKCDTVFSKYGVVKTKIDGKHIDIATLRKEKSYSDSRHPDEIIFIKDINEDYKRRDLTINAIYIDEKYEIQKVSELGYQDLMEKKLRFIGDPLTRIKEDPLRILRCLRFLKEYDLKIDEKTYKILLDNFDLIKNLNVDKVNEEKKKYKKATGEDSYAI